MLKKNLSIIGQMPDEMENGNKGHDNAKLNMKPKKRKVPRKRKLGVDRES